MNWKNEVVKIRVRKISIERDLDNPPKVIEDEGDTVIVTANPSWSYNRHYQSATCSESRCSLWDGKRCVDTGNRASYGDPCYPVVDNIITMLESKLK
jgi:hypothetical protein